MFFQKPFSLSPRVAVLTLMQGFRLYSGSTDAADVSFRTFIIRHLMLRFLFIYAEIFLYKSSLQPFRLHFVNSSRDAGCPSVSISSAFFTFLYFLLKAYFSLSGCVSGGRVAPTLRMFLSEHSLSGT